MLKAWDVHGNRLWLRREFLPTFSMSVSVQETKRTPNVRGARGSHIILETSAQLLGKQRHMPIHDDLSLR
jgi:hypothetical protein